jgi:RNA polymerase sigma factor (sigma-70 family)
VWLRVAERIGTVAPDSFRGWLRTIARNTCLNFLRTHASRARITDADATAEVLLAVDHGSLAPERSVLAQDDRREMWEALGGLSEDDRIVLRLRELEERSYVEIAEMLSTTPHAAEVRTHRARGRLRRALEALMAARRQWHVNPLKIAKLVDDAHAHDVALPEHVNECDACAQDIAAMRRGRELFGGLGALLLLPREIAALASRLRGSVRGDAEAQLSAASLSTAPAALPAAFVQTGGIAVTAVFALTAVFSPVSADAALGEPAQSEADRIALPAAADRSDDVLRLDERAVVVTVDSDDSSGIDTTAAAEPVSPVSGTKTTWSSQPPDMGPTNGAPPSTPAPSSVLQDPARPPKSGTTKSPAPRVGALANEHTATAVASKAGTVIASARASASAAPAATRVERDGDRSSDATTAQPSAKTETSGQRSAPTAVTPSVPSSEPKPATDARQRRGAP